MQPFYQLFRELDREGPGEPADVAWAVMRANLANDAVICDVACGSGADILPLLEACPNGRVVAIDKQEHFVSEAKDRCKNDPRVDLRVGDMSDIMSGTTSETGAPYDFIWCAGAVYFTGIEAALKTWQPALNTGGTIAFSLPCWWADTPSKPARDFWAGYAEMTNEAGIAAQIDAAGYDLIGTRRLADSAWQGYYASLQQRIEMLQDGADPTLQSVLEETRREMNIYHEYGNEYGYLLSVVRPK